VLPVDGTANAVAADPVTGTLVVATDQGLREVEAKTNLGRAVRRLLGA
jgi:hypothetical protein